MNEFYEVMTEAEKAEFRTKWILEFGYTERTFYNMVGNCKKLKRYEAIKTMELWYEIVKPKKEQQI